MDTVRSAWPRSDTVRRPHRGSVYGLATKITIVFTVFSAFLFIGVPVLARAEDKLEAEYYRRLDDWVTRGGPIPEVQDTVVQTCGKLVMWTASVAEKLAFTTTRRDDFDFRVDVCVKMTVNRVHPQPEFEKPHLVKMICDESNVRLFVALCERSGLRQAKPTERHDLEIVSKDDAVRLFATPRREWEKNIDAVVTAGKGTRLSPSSSGLVGMAVKTDSGYLMTRLSYAKGDSKPDVIQLVIGYQPGQARFTDAQAQQIIAAVQRQLAPEFEVTGDFERPEGGSAFFFFISAKE